MSRIIIATEYVEESQNSTGYFWSRIILGLKTEGFDVAVLEQRSLNKFHLLQDNSKILKRIFKQLIIAADLANQIYRTIRGNSIVFTGTNPTIFLCLMPIVKKIFNVKWVLLVHDVFPDNLLAAGLIKKNNPIFKITSNYFSWVYSAPDKLICIGRDMQALMCQKTKGKAKTVFVPNWANGDDVFPLVRSELNFFNIYGWENHVVFQFFGNIGRVQGVENLLQAIRLVTAKNAAFVFIGDGALVPSVLKFIENNPTKEIKFLGSMPMDQKNEVLSLCDVALVSLEVGMLGLGVPSKSYFSLAAGKPLLAAVDAESEIGLMLNEFPVGWRCDSGSPYQLANLIDEICARPEEINKKMPREIFLNNYSENIMIKKINQIIRSICV